MSCNWIELPLGDFIELKRGYDLPKGKRKSGDYPIVSSAGATDFHAEFKVTAPGVVTGRYGTIGEVFYVDKDFWPLNTTLYVKDLKDNCPEFVYYLLKTFDFHKYSDKAAVPGVNRNHLHMEKVCVPSDYVWQERIASYISKFDKKITLNTQTNQTLEEMAQAIFKSWFVDFDPVKAKMNGQQPEGMDASTASLFPEKLVESELGLIPEGWSASSMGEHFNITMGQSPKGETYNEEGEGIAFFQGRRDFGFRYPDVRVYTTDPKRFAKAGDTLISVRAPVGDKNMAAIDCCIGRGVAAIKHKSDSRSFTYAFMSHIEKKLGDSGSSGTVFSSINQKELKKVSFVAPPQKLIEAFHKIVDPIDQKVEVLSKEIESLSSLRDTLLPKLLSGEIELEGAGVVEENDVVNRLLKQMDFGVKFRPRQESIPEGSFGYIRLSGTFGSDGGTFVSIPKAVQALTKITSADGIYGEIAGNAMTENVLSGTVEIVTNNIIPLGVLNKICTAVFGKKTPIKSRNAVLLTSIHQAKNKTLDGIMNEQAKRFAFLEQSTMDEQEFGESLRYLESIGVVKCEGQHIALLDTIVQH